MPVSCCQTPQQLLFPVPCCRCRCPAIRSSAGGTVVVRSPAGQGSASHLGLSSSSCQLHITRGRGRGGCRATFPVTCCSSVTPVHPMFHAAPPEQWLLLLLLLLLLLRRASGGRHMSASVSSSIMEVRQKAGHLQHQAVSRRQGPPGRRHQYLMTYTAADTRHLHWHIAAAVMPSRCRVHAGRGGQRSPGGRDGPWQTSMFVDLQVVSSRRAAGPLVTQPA